MSLENQRKKESLTALHGEEIINLQHSDDMFLLKYLVRIKRQDPISLDGLQYEIDLVMVEKENRRESLAILTLDNLTPK